MSNNISTTCVEIDEERLYWTWRYSATSPDFCIDQTDCSLCWPLHQLQFEIWVNPEKDFSTQGHA
jgi:hypothetical protein